MGLLKILFVLVLVAFPIAEVLRIPVRSDVAITINDLLVVITVVYFYFLVFIRKLSFPKVLPIKTLAVFSLVLLLTLVLQIFRYQLYQLIIAFFYLLRWVCYATIPFILLTFDKRFTKRIIIILLTTGTVISLGGLVQYFLYPNLRNLYYAGWDDHLYRVFSSFLDPNFAGIFFACFLLFILAFLISNYFKNTKWSISLVIISIITFISFFLTYSRSAYISFALGIVIELILLKKKKYLIVLLAILLVGIIATPKNLKSEGVNLFRTASVNARSDSIREAVKIISQNPYFGVGFNAYRYAQNQDGYLIGNKWQTSHSGAGTDNSFLFVLATAGIVGLLAFCYLWAAILKYEFTKYKTTKTVFSTLVIASFVAVAIDSFFINSLFYPFIMEWLWLMIGLSGRSE